MTSFFSCSLHRIADVRVFGILPVGKPKLADQVTTFHVLLRRVIPTTNGVLDGLSWGDLWGVDTFCHGAFEIGDRLAGATAILLWGTGDWPARVTECSY